MLLELLGNVSLVVAGDSNKRQCRKLSATFSSFWEICCHGRSGVFGKGHTSAPKSMAVNLSMDRPGRVDSSGLRKFSTAEEVAMTTFRASLLCTECSGPEKHSTGSDFG